jgi:rare lipoprotein A
MQNRIRRRPGGILSRPYVLIILGIVVASCGLLEEKDRAPAKPRDVSAIPNPIPKKEPPSRYGNPPFYDVDGRRYYTLKTSYGYEERGIASWYGVKFHGRRTSSGETYDMYKMTAAHKTLPLPSYLEVTNLQNGRSVIVRVNDRGPFHENRILDLSYAAAKKLGIADVGTGIVDIRAIQPGDMRFARHNHVPMKPIANNPIYLQVGAFNQKSNADRVRERIAVNAREAARITTASSTNGQLYRVQVGPLFDVERIDLAVERLSKIGITEHHLVFE